MAGIEEVARSAGVSIATVSRALRGLPNVSPATRRAVEEAAARLGYVASPSAAGLSSGRHRAVAIAVPSLGRWFYTAVVDGAERVLREHGYDVFLINLGADGTELGLQKGRVFHSTQLRKRADAVLALGVSFSKEERRELRSLALPTVIVGAQVRGVRTVGLDEAKAGALGMNHLLALGHRRIAHVGGLDEYGMNPSVAGLRRAAWEDGLHAAGLEPDSALFVNGGFVLPTAKAAALALLDTDDPPTAVFCGSDEMAFGVLLAAGELGIDVPGDVSVVGIDDHVWSDAFGLTTVRQNPYQQGAIAAELLLADLRGDAARGGRATRVGSELVVRSTSAAPRSARLLHPRHHSPRPVAPRIAPGAISPALPRPSALR